MRRPPIIGTGVTLALVMGAMTATGAVAAQPQFSAPYPNAFHSTSKGMTLETVGGLKVSCQAGSNQGEVTGPTAAVLTISFTGCANAGASCQNGAVAGQIVSQRLAATLGYLNRRHTAVGLDLSTPPGTPLASFFCGEDLTVEVFGSVIGRISPIDAVVEPKAHMTLRFAQHEGHQAIKRLVGGSRDVPMTSVLGGPLQESGLSTTDLLAFASPIEIVTDDSPPVFAGLQSATTCIPGPIGSGTTSSYHLAWEAAADDFTPSSEIVYEIYQANKAGGEDFLKPTYTTGPGATSFDTPKLPSGYAFYFVVRARDQAGNEDSNAREREGQNLCA